MGRIGSIPSEELKKYRYCIKGFEELLSLSNQAGGTLLTC